MASFKSRIVSREHFTAAGCGEKMTELPAARMEIELLMTVAVGLVDGMMAATMPNGAHSTKVRPSSPV
ncbi:hypothetical protein D3C83_217070 [compost metagenome]